MILVPINADGVPKFGVISTGEFANTAAPEPVSSVSAPLRAALVNDPSEVALPVEVTAPVKFAFVVTVSANAARSTYRLDTFVVDATEKGAVPVVTVDCNCPAAVRASLPCAIDIEPSPFTRK